MKTISRYIMTLALLLTAVTGAWATDGVILKELTVPSEWNNDDTPLTVDDLPGFKEFSSLTDDEAKALLNSVPADKVLIIYGAGASSNSFKLVQNAGTKVNVGELPLTHENLFSEKDNYKFYYTTSDAIEVTPVAEPAANTKQWTFTMPGSDVVLTPIYAPTKVTLAANDVQKGSVSMGGETKVEWTADTWSGWTFNTKEYTVDDITMTSTQDAYINEITEAGDYLHSLSFFVNQWEDNSTVTFSTTGDPFSRIEFTMIDNYGEYNPNIKPNDNWTFEGKSAVWEGEATKSLTLQSCSTEVSKITFYKDGGIPEGVTVNGDGTFTVAQTATVKVKAIPAEGYKLKGWSDASDCTDLVREITIEPGEEDMIITAIFEEMTYTATFTAANANTIESGKATVTVGGAAATVTEGKLEGVKMGSEVKLKAADGYKFRKVEVKKGGAATLATALENGATVVIAFKYRDDGTCTFTNNNGTFTFVSGTGQLGGGNGPKQLSVENGKLIFKGSGTNSFTDRWSWYGFQVTFDPTANTYEVWKGSDLDVASFTSISVNGTDITDQLSELK
ncbi:hypothetical protein L6466_14045 [Prevotella communis]|uniref:InlB B-repeat-containing protein n=1 Tax=Prevotella communis TaxID=2913614 RepID=UPI001EDC1B39|nr:hypothetical protein [Prevotella communis]UKK62229.1 hypothetical protein L6468_00170 [Prevotella communis]UKK65056.1 hypothetical protein L6473_00170 [Prevotella communis]UKK67441.1 hypothetical protein L6464_12620 [Prevotella communis]UKK70412.1 hypothetical protein L6466_14045 [Prevotella communis]